MCSVCDSLPSKVWDGSQELLVSAFHDNSGNTHLLLIQGQEKPESVNIQIKFCPWCGKPLTSK